MLPLLLPPHCLALSPKIVWSSSNERCYWRAGDVDDKPSPFLHGLKLPSSIGEHSAPSFLFQLRKSIPLLLRRFAIPGLVFAIYLFFPVSVYCHLLGMEERSMCICLWLNRHLSNGFTDPILIQVLVALEKMYMPELAYWFRDQFLSSLYSSTFTLAI